MAAAPQSGLGMRLPRWAGAFLGTLFVFVSSVVLGAIVHSNAPSTRRLAMREVNAILAPSFRGRVRIDSLGGLGLFGVSGANATVDDPSGRSVIVAKGVRVRLATWAAVRSALFAKSAPLTVDLSDLSIDTLDVCVDTDPSGQLDLVNAFAPRSRASASDPNARGFYLDLSKITLRHAWIHGHMAGVPPIDADIDGLRGTFTVAPDALEGSIARAMVLARGIANGADLVGSPEARVHWPSNASTTRDVRVEWEGSVAGIPHSVHASLACDRVDAVVDIPHVEPASVKAIWADSPIEQATVAHLEAHGALEDIGVDLRAQLGDASLKAGGRLSFANAKSARISIDARDVDVRQLASAAPTTRLGLAGDVSADMTSDGAISGNAVLRFLGGKVASKAVPAASIRATLSLSDARALTGNANVVVEEPGVPAKIDVRVVPKGKSFTVDFALDAKSADLARVPELEHAIGGSMSVSAAGQLDVAAMAVEGRVQVAADGITSGATRVASASLEGQVRGALAAPTIDVALRSRDVVAGRVHLTSAMVRASGSALAPHVVASVRGPDIPDIDARADVGLAMGVALDGLRVDLSRRGEQGVVTARHVSFTNGDLRVEDGKIDGVGAPMAVSLAMTHDTLKVRASTHGVELARVARLANLERALKGGTAALETDLTLRRASGEGRMVLDLSRASFGPTKNVAAHVDVSLQGRRLAGKAHIQADEIGSVDVDVPAVELAVGEPLSASSWTKAWGTVDVDARVDLAKMAAVLPPDDSPLGPASGDVRLQAHVSRDNLHDLTPDVTLSVTTDHLDVSAKRPTTREIDGVLVYPQAAWHLAGIDFTFTGHADGNTGAVVLSTELRDAKGQLAQLDASTAHFPYADALGGMDRLVTSLRSMLFEAHVVVPEQGLAKMPPILMQPYVTGRVQADLRVKGTVRAPAVDATATIRHGSFSGNGLSTPLDVDARVRYDGERGDAAIQARSASQPVLDVSAQVDAAVARLLGDSSDGDSDPVWKASARAHFTEFPMASIALLDDKLVSGKLSGDLSLVDLHQNAHADVALDVDGLSVGSVAYKSAHLQLKADGHVLDGTVRIDQADGFVETKAHGMASWGAAMAPVLDRAAHLDFSLSSKNFRIAALLPFVDSLDELDGRLDANARVELDPTQNKARASGTLALSRGTAEVAAGGGELHDIAANVKLAPDGTISVEKLTAKGLSGQLSMTGTAKLDGAALRSAHAVIEIPSRTPVPLSAAGAEVGNVDGRIEISELTSEGNAMAVKVEIPKLRVALPEGVSNNAQALGPMSKVSIGAHRGDPSTFVVLPLDSAKAQAPAKAGSSRLTIETHLADVEVVRGTELKVDLDGRVNVVAAGETPQVTGQIRLKRGGRLDVQGKKFTVEDGTVTFVGSDPSNPEVVVKASWAARRTGQPSTPSSTVRSRQGR